jgi:hypothetical protein
MNCLLQEIIPIEARSLKAHAPTVEWKRQSAISGVLLG